MSQSNNEVKKNFRQATISYIVISALMIILGIVMTIYPEASAEVLCYIIGALVILFGVAKIISYFSKGYVRFVFQFDLAIGLFLIVLGIMIIAHPVSISVMLPLCIGIIWFVEGAAQLQSSIEACRYKVRGWWVLSIFAVLTAVLGVLLVVNPFSGMNALMIFMGISLIVDGIENLYKVLYLNKALKNVKTETRRVDVLDDGTEIYL